MALDLRSVTIANSDQVCNGRQTSLSTNPRNHIGQSRVIQNDYASIAHAASVAAVVV